MDLIFCFKKGIKQPMPTSPLRSTKKNIEKRIKDGRGSGERENYIPWIYVHELASLGVSHNPLGLTVDRLYHLFSNGEEQWFTILDWLGKYKDIREQYPLLPHEETIEIAQMLGIPHPIDPRTNYPIVITTDFLLTVDMDYAFSYEALSFKYSESQATEKKKQENTLEDIRTLEKLAIEREYYRRRSIRWRIGTEREIPSNLYENLKMARRHWEQAEIDPRRYEHAAIYLSRHILSEHRPLSDICTVCDIAQGFPTGEGISLSIAYSLFWRKRWKTNLYMLIEPSEPLVLSYIDPSLID
jgi:hypothetical protein